MGILSFGEGEPGFSPTKSSEYSRGGGFADAARGAVGRCACAEPSSTLRGAKSASDACGSFIAFSVDPLEREVTDTSSVPREAFVDRRVDGSESCCWNAFALEAINLSCSWLSRMGQLRARAPMTSICLRSAPWSQYKRIWVILPALSKCTMWT